MLLVHASYQLVHARQEADLGSDIGSYGNIFGARQLQAPVTFTGTDSIGQRLVGIAGFQIMRIELY